MALARLAMKNLNLGRRVPLVTSWRLSSTLAADESAGGGTTTITATDDKTGGGGSDVAVSKKKGRRGRSLWKNNRSDLSFNDLFPSSLGNALMRATDNINKLLHNFSPSRLIGRVKEKDDHYKVKFHLPGLKKEDLKITVADGILRIEGQHKEEEEHESEDDELEEFRAFYGYYDSSLVLPENAKVDEIKAEMKHGVLTVIIPKSEDVKKNVKEIEVN